MKHQMIFTILNETIISFPETSKIKDNLKQKNPVSKAHNPEKYTKIFDMYTSSICAESFLTS